MSRTDGTGRTGHRQLEELWTRLSERDLGILRSVARLQFVSSPLLQRLHFGLDEHTPLGAARTTRRVLERLTKQRLLIRLDRTIGGVRAGSSGHIYALGPVGARLVQRERPRPRFREPSTTFLRHRLAIAELYVEIVEQARAGRFELLAHETEPACWRRYATLGGEVGILKSDLRLTLGVGDYETHWFIEVDLGTEHLPALLRKCRQYEAAFLAGDEQRACGLFPRVLFLMSSPERVEALTLAIAREPDLPRLFVVRRAERAIETLAQATEIAR